MASSGVLESEASGTGAVLSKAPPKMAQVSAEEPPVSRFEPVALISDGHEDHPFRTRGRTRSHLPDEVTDGQNAAESQGRRPKDQVLLGETLLAAAYMDDALKHRHVEFLPEPDRLRLYEVYKHPALVLLLYACYLTNLALALFEDPAVPGLSLPYWATMIPELFCLGFFAFRLLHEMAFTDVKTFWRDTKHIIVASILGLTFIDVISYTALREAGGGGDDPAAAVRWSRPLRPFLIVNFPESRQLRRAYRNIRNTLGDVFSVMVLLMISVSLFALMAFKLFDKKGLQKAAGGEGATSYFPDFLDALWDLYVLTTTANNPDIMMPAYDYAPWYAVFFVVFLIINLYMFMSVFLAVVYHSYKANLREEVRQSLLLKRSLLDKVYDLLRDKEGEGIDKQTFLNLMVRVSKRNNCWEYFEVIWMVMDFRGSGKVDRQEFRNVIELLQYKVTDTTDTRTAIERLIPQVYNSKYSRKLIHCVKHVYFRYLFDLVIFANAIFIGFNLDGGEWYFLALFTAEILLKLYAFGFQAFFQKMWNIFDVVVVGLALLVSTYQEIEKDPIGSGITLDILLAMRVVRIFKIFHSVPRFRIIINTIFHILPSMATYAAVMALFYYFFAIIGMEAFKGKIRYTGPYYGNGSSTTEPYCGNFRLKDSKFYESHYCSNNFNDIASAFVTLFELMVVNQWHVITEGHVLVTESKFARIYFFAFHFVCVIVILNIFSAYVIEAFMLEYSASYSRNSTTTIQSRRDDQSSEMASRINQMGLGFGSKPVLAMKKSSKASAKPSSADASDQGPKKGSRTKKVQSSGDSLTLIEIDENSSEENDDDVVDADHGSMQILPHTEDVGNSKYVNVSNRTKLRFHLKKKSRTAQNILEKMFEGDLQTEDAAGEA